jgi:hypothetical protein
MIKTIGAIASIALALGAVQATTTTKLLKELEVQESTASTALAPTTEELCDMTLPDSVCLFEGKKVLMPDAAPAGLSGRWTFDEIKPVDSSGNGRHATFTVGAAPGVMGRGASGRFTGFNSLKINDDAGTLLNDQKDGNYGLSFWLYLPQNPVELESTHSSAGEQLMCSLVTKGENTDTPAVSIMMSPKTRRLEVRAVTGKTGPQHETFKSTGKIRTNAWVHVALLRANRVVSGQAVSDFTLWLNGVQDLSGTTKFGSTVANKDPLVVGSPKNEEEAGACRIMMFVDELKTYSDGFEVDVFPEFVSAEAAPALGGIDPGFARCGCTDCTSIEASTDACSEGYHLCTEMELNVGGYQIGKTNGCLDYAVKNVWTVEDAKNEVAGKGVGMCCRSAW